jgi:CheY-like chemotaxis protein
MTLTVLKALIKKIGTFEVETAMDGKEALARLQNPDLPPFAAVLTDMWLPELVGEGLVKAIRADPKLAKMPVHVSPPTLSYRRRLPKRALTASS